MICLIKIIEIYLVIKLVLMSALEIKGIIYTNEKYFIALCHGVIKSSTNERIRLRIGL